MEQVPERCQLGDGGPASRAVPRPRPRLFGAAAEPPEDAGFAPVRDGSAFGPFDLPETFGQRTEGKGGKAPRLTSGSHAGRTRLDAPTGASKPL